MIYSFEETRLIDSAGAFAMGAHNAIGHVRKYTGIPYWNHLKNVANIVRGCEHHASAEMISAAWLHDTVEDTQVTISQISDVFGLKIAEYVYYLTDLPKDAGNRAFRKADTIERFRNAPYEVKTIKLADLIDNGQDIVKHDQHFAFRFMTEKRELLKVLGDGNPQLYVIASKMVSDFFNEHERTQNAA